MLKKMFVLTVTTAIVAGVITVSAPVPVFAADTRPEWVINFVNYDKPGIIYGTSFSAYDKRKKETKKVARDTAYADALQKMASKLETTVQSSVQTQLQNEIEQVSGKKPKEITKESLDSVTKVLIDSVLGRKQFEEWVDEKKGEYWVHAYMTVAEANRALEEALKKRKEENIAKLKSAVDVNDAAEIALANGDISTAFDQYNAALKLISGISGAISLENGVSNLEIKPKLENRFKEIITSIKTVGYGDNQNVQLNQGTEKPLTVKVYYTLKGTNIAAKNVPLVYSFTQGSGELDQRVRTDEEGMARAKVINVTTEGQNVITATFDLDELSKIHPSFVLLTGLKAKFTVNAISQKQSKRLYVAIEELNFESPRSDSYIGTELNRILVENGYKVVTARQVGNAEPTEEGLKGKVEVLISGKASTEYIGDTMPLPDGTVMKFNPSSRAKVTIEVIDIVTGKAIGSVTEAGIKGFGRTKEESGDEALKKAAQKVSKSVMIQVEKAFAK
ncbi:MAG: hypothetical protein WC955_05915 [Elusimicrobiota bacterium]